jgi:hypothetical protein
MARTGGEAGGVAGFKRCSLQNREPNKLLDKYSFDRYKDHFT